MSMNVHKLRAEFRSLEQAPLLPSLWDAAGTPIAWETPPLMWSARAVYWAARALWRNLDGPDPARLRALLEPRAALAESAGSRVIRCEWLARALQRAYRVHGVASDWRYLRRRHRLERASDHTTSRSLALIEQLESRAYLLGAGQRLPVGANYIERVTRDTVTQPVWL